MKKRLFSLILAMAVILSGSCIAFASEEADNTQVFTIPICAEENNHKDRMELMSIGSYGPAITDVLYDSFSAEYFNIYVEMDNFADARKNLTLSVKDEDGTEVAKQESVSYSYSALVYRMKIIGEMEDGLEYSIEFTYDGAYELETFVEEAYVCPEFLVWAEEVKILNQHLNIFLLTMANTEINTEYTLFYEDANYDTFSIDVTTDENNCILAEFGEDAVFSIENTIYVCEQGTEDYWDSLGQVYFYECEPYDISNEGVSCEEIIAEDAETVYFEFYEKGYAWEMYSSGDEENIDVYLFDVTAGKKVSSGMTNVMFESDWGGIWGEVEISSALYADHEYIMVLDDGYSLRVCDTTVTDQKKIEDIYLYDTNLESVTAISSSTSKFYCRISTLNIEPGEFSVVMKDSSSQVVATSSYNSSKNACLMTVKESLVPGKYTLTATVDGISFTRSINVLGSGQGTTQKLVEQASSSAHIADGTVFVEVWLENSGFEPSELTYKLTLNDGTEIEAEYHRTLYEDERDIYFVVKTDLAQGGFRNAMLKMYYDGEYLIPYDEPNMRIRNMVMYQDMSAFVYNEFQLTEGDITLYIEGINENGTYTLCGYSDETQELVEITATGSDSVTFRKSQLDRIVTIHDLFNGYNYSDKMLVLEYNDEFVAKMYNDYIGKNLLADSFGFQKASTSKKYEVINLPYQTYSKYKLSTTEAGLNSVSYKTIDVGVLHELEEEEGVQTVYAKFKTASGEESDVQKISIYYDATAPELQILSKMSGQYTIGEMEESFNLPYYIRANEEGLLYAEFFDKKGNQLGYEYTSEVYEGTIADYVHIYDNGEIGQAKKLVVYMKDRAGNKSEEFEFNVSVVYGCENLGNTRSRIMYSNDEVRVSARDDSFYKDDVILAAVYDENNKLIEIAKTVIEEDTDSCYVTFENTVDSGNKVKVFVMNDESKPLTYAETLYAE